MDYNQKRFLYFIPIIVFLLLISFLFHILQKKDENALVTYREAIEYANEINLEVNAGHDLNLENLSTLLSYGEIKEVSIGHALISESLIYGIEKTIQKYIKITQ